jgi:hypothetical protein
MPKQDQLAELNERVAQLSDEVARLQDVNAIRHLQFSYGYFIDKCLYDETVDCYAEDGEVEFMGGIFKGKAGIRRLYCGRFRENFTGGHNGPVYGFLLDHPQIQDIIHVDPDRKTGYARARSMMQAGRHYLGATKLSLGRIQPGSSATRQWWEGGLYENTYTREKGVWKIKRLNYRPVWHANFENGWAFTPPSYVPFFAETFPKDPIGPDQLSPIKPVLWPDHDVLPFHYPHPVTGKKIKIPKASTRPPKPKA